MHKNPGSFYRELTVDIPRVRERSALRYATLNQELLEEFEKLNHNSDIIRIANGKEERHV